jgi:hypothetical protein
MFYINKINVTIFRKVIPISKIGENNALLMGKIEKLFNRDAFFYLIICLSNDGRSRF